ncbi:glutamine synthetase [Candidatus Saccharibacteria bacterium]|nr:glutamine synthetase [Candidatus Saccharibacteria bacterium]
MEDTKKLKNFLELSYDEIEDLNLSARAITDPEEARNVHVAYLEDAKQLKAVTLCFSDIEGRLHMLDYDRKFFLASLDNLTFDGSSIRGLSEQSESDLRLKVDWTSLTFVPADIFGAGKVIVFANICDRELKPYATDFRAQLQAYTEELKAKQDMEAYMAPEIEGFLLQGVDAEQHYDGRKGFELVSTGGYFHSLPLDELRRFIDATAEVQRAMGFGNEKDHPEVAPSQFEINYRYTTVVRACDQAQLYKLVCRQIAMNMGMTATFLPKPLQGVNGNGMHTNISLAKNGKNIFYDAKGDSGLSKIGWDFIGNILSHAPELCLILNSSVNAYRRLDPAYEAPNQIKASANDRSSMVRIPFANEKTARIEVRSVAPDANPYLVALALVKTGLNGTPPQNDDSKRPRVRFLPSTIHDAIRIFKTSDYITSLLGETCKQKYVAPKQAVANRSGIDLGTRIKSEEIIHHHEITNQYLWNSF